jgi:ribosome-associated protein
MNETIRNNPTEPTPGATKPEATKDGIENAVQPAAPTLPPVTGDEFFARVRTAVRAADDKKAQDIVVLRLSALTSFTDYFLICSANSTRQVQAVADEIEAQLKKEGVRPLSIEGYNSAEWVLIDYGPMVVHVFLESARRFYDLERLWRDAEKVTVGQ